MIRDLINAKFDPTTEPFIVSILKALKQRAYLLLRSKSNIYVPKAARLMGVIDDQNLL